MDKEEGIDEVSPVILYDLYYQKIVTEPSKINNIPFKLQEDTPLLNTRASK